VAGLVVERCLQSNSSGLPDTGIMRYHFHAEMGAIIYIINIRLLMLSP